MVHAETLRFKEEGVFGVIKNVFMPWYNAYRFLVQNVLRLEADCGERFYPSEVRERPTLYAVWEVPLLLWVLVRSAYAISKMAS